MNSGFAARLLIILSYKEWVSLVPGVSLRETTETVRIEKREITNII